jgi:hypothetical protein
MQDYDTSHIHDSTVNANHGTKKGANEPIEADGKIGKGQSFDGTDDKITVTTDASLDLAVPFTVSAWAKIDDTSKLSSILAKPTNFGAGSTNYFLGSTGNAIYFDFSSGGVRKSRSSSIAGFTGWHNYCGIYDGNKQILYVDGVNVSENSLGSITPDITAGDLFIGCSDGWRWYEDGTVDEIRISSVARSSAWIAYEYANQNPADGGLTWEAVPADAIQIYSADYAAGDARLFLRGESGYPMSLGNQSLCGGDQASGNLTLRSTSNATKGIVYSDSKIRSTGASLYRRYYHIPLTASNPGASGATWVAPGTNTTGGWNLTSATNYLDGETDIHTSWDAASDLKFECRFVVNVDNSGGGAGDTVDLRLQVFYKGIGDTACKSQVVEVSTVIGASARYKQFKVVFPIDYDYASNVVEVNDIMSFRLNLETDTSEVDDIVLSDMSVSYLTTHVGIEDGDE